MKQANGWIRLDKKLLSNKIFDSEKALKVWIWCLLSASYEEKDILFLRQTVKLKPGQFITGRISAGNKLNMAPTTAWFYLCQLSPEYLDIKSTNKYSIITIRKWSDYQNLDSKRTTDDTTDGQQTDTTNNINNINNINYAKTSFAEKQVTEEFNQEGYIGKMQNDPKRHIKLIANYIKLIGAELPSKKAAQDFIRRHTRSAVALAEYPDDKIDEALDKVVNSQYITKWDLGTVLKYIN